MIPAGRSECHAHGFAWAWLPGLTIFAGHAEPWARHQAPVQSTLAAGGRGALALPPPPPEDAAWGRGWSRLDGGVDFAPSLQPLPTTTNRVRTITRQIMRVVPRG